MTAAVQGRRGGSGSWKRDESAAAVRRRDKLLTAVLAAKHYARAAADELDGLTVAAHAAGASNRRLSQLLGLTTGTGANLRWRRAAARIATDDLEASAVRDLPELERRITAAVEHRRAAEIELGRLIRRAWEAGAYDTEISRVLGVTAEAVRQRRIGMVSGTQLGSARWLKSSP